MTDLPVLILRPQPGADATAMRTRALGLETRILPLFAVEPMPWRAPPAERYDAVLLTSANAVRTVGVRLDALGALPCWCVGAATATAARDAGLTVARQGDTDLVTLLHGAPRARLLWLAAEHHSPLPDGAADHIDILPVYRAVAMPADPAILSDPAVALLHSTRAARYFAEICPDRALVQIVAISDAVARAAGHGWAGLTIASRPDDGEMVAIAARLCHKHAH